MASADAGGINSENLITEERSNGSLTNDLILCGGNLWSLAFSSQSKMTAEKRTK
jgi:hypothetical protein